MALKASYHCPSGLSVRDHKSTSTAGRNLLFPSPFTVKMAILCKAIGMRGEDKAEDHLTWIRSLEIAVEPPAFFSVSQGIAKIRNLEENKGAMTPELKARIARGTNYRPSIVAQEFNFYSEPLSFYIDNPPPGRRADLEEALWQINYFGKRGSFVQCLCVEESETPETAFRPVEGEASLREGKMVFPLLDMTEKTLWKDVNALDESKPADEFRRERLYAGSLRLRDAFSDCAVYEKSVL